MRRIVTIALLLAVAASCTGSDSAASSARPAAATTPALTTSAATVTPEPATNADLAAAPLGTFVIARPGAGVLRLDPPLGDRQPALELEVYDQPNGERRRLVDATSDGTKRPVEILNWNEHDAASVFRVIAGAPSDEWIKIQAPTRPHDRYVWVRADDYVFASTTKRIEIDLADEGLLQLFDGEGVVMRSPIVQGRDVRPTATHLTYVESGVAGWRLNPAHGAAVLSIASFSESLGMRGREMLPSNFLHGTNQPDLVGQRLSSGSVRLPDEQLTTLIRNVEPGTPVLIFDSSAAGASRAEVLARPALPAITTDLDETPWVVLPPNSDIAPHLWALCDSSTTDFCVADLPSANAHDLQTPLNAHLFAVAKAGEEAIPVFDQPGGPPRMLKYENDVDGVTLDYPLFPTTVFGEPLVLSVIESSRDDQWLLVRAPVLPHDQAIWVEADRFDLDATTVWIEIDIGYELLDKHGILVVWDQYQEVMAARIASGREFRPTTLTATYVDQIIEGSILSPAYGPSLLSTPSYSERLGTFGGGGMPQQAIHGVSPEIEDEHLGHYVTSGSIHVSTDDANRLAAIDGIVGAPVFIYDSSAGVSVETVAGRKPTMARTKPHELGSLEQPVGSFT